MHSPHRLQVEKSSVKRVARIFFEPSGRTPSTAMHSDGQIRVHALQAMQSCVPVSGKRTSSIGPPHFVTSGSSCGYWSVTGRRTRYFPVTPSPMRRLRAPAQSRRGRFRTLIAAVPRRTP